MIKLVRTPIPPVLAKNQVAWTAAVLEATSPAIVKRAAGRYRHVDVKNALQQMFHDKCAYCESKITHVAYAHIEHFRPKSDPAFRHLIFDWNNLLLSCPVCNGPEFKGDRFPAGADLGPPVNPCDDDPNEHLDFVFDPTARLATVVPKSPRGRTSEKLYGLNRPALREHRSILVKQLAVLALMRDTTPEARALLDEARQDSAEYSAFVKTLFPD